MKDQPSPTNIINLNAAVTEIKLACDSMPEGSGRSPFFFVAGAGLSSPSIPLSAAIQDDCRNRARTVGRGEEPGPEVSAADRYSHWFTAAFPHRKMRQEYLRTLISGAAITHATFRLADLLLQGKTHKNCSNAKL